MKINSKNNIFYNIYQKSNPHFNLKIPFNSISTIKKLYGSESLLFNNFIIYSKEKSSSTITQEKTMKKELDDNEANRISEGLNNLGKYYIIPESLKYLDEDKQYEQAIKLPGKYITHIMKKAGINLESMIFYLGIQIVSHEINENVVINYYAFEKIFNLIELLLIKFNNNNNNNNDLNITFYSFNQILKNCGIKLEEIIPFLHIDIKNINRKELNYNTIPIYKAYKIRQLKQLIPDEVQNNNIDIMKGTESLIRIEKDDFDFFDVFRKEESNLINDIMNKIEIKKEEIKKQCENEENYIAEINKENKAFYIKKNIFDNLIKNIDNNNNLIITDINNNEIPINKEIIVTNNNKNIKPLIKISNKNNKNEYIFISKDDLINKYMKNFKYIKQEDTFSGKGINGEPKDIKGLYLDINIEQLLENNKDKDIINTNEIIDSKEKMLISPTKNEMNEINSFPNSKEKLKLNEEKQEYDIEPEYGNIINPYNDIPFKQIRNFRREENKNEENNNDKILLRNIPGREIKTYRIRRAILFKRPIGNKKEELEKK